MRAEQAGPAQPADRSPRGLPAPAWTPGAAGLVAGVQLEELVSDSVVHLAADGTVLSLNPGAQRLLGVEAGRAVGRHVRSLSRFEHTDAFLAELRAALHEGRSWRDVEVRVTTHAGRAVVLETSATALRDAAGACAGAVVVSRDVTAVRELEQSLRAATRALRERATEAVQATGRDALTGVASRSLLQERLAAALARCAGGKDGEEDGEGEGACVHVLLADLDGFRAVNDSYGLATGDALLTAFAAHLRAALPPGATAGRLGADEFAVVLPGGDEQARRVARALRGWSPPSPLPARGRRPEDVPVRASVGLVRATAAECRSPFDTGVRAVLQRAEEAVLAAKRSAPAGPPAAQAGWERASSAATSSA
ncbi:diguanylate cyclase [Kineococcus sp. T13]|uniref:diguanylate cyclase domain-containing protein n=1 Tax=Kineococcus vitellinus TaxID=2696565 RepID=UPI0014127329|nr:diguanylate cyclase [Kineococcus vitellinus]